MATTPAKPAPKPAQTPAPATAPVKAAPTAPAFSLATVTPVKVEPPKRSGSPTAGRKGRDNTVVEGWLKNLWESRTGSERTSQGMQIAVPASMVPEVRSRLLDAAAKHEIGVSIRPTVKEFKEANYKDTDEVKVVFAVKPRKANKPKDTASDAK